MTTKDYAPLTEETPCGLGFWCDGKGGDWHFAEKYEHDIVIHKVGTRGIHKAGGYWKPYTPTPGPIMEQPIQGETPVTGVLTLPDGSRWYAVKFGDLICWDTRQAWLSRSSDYTFTPDAKEPNP